MIKLVSVCFLLGVYAVSPCLADDSVYSVGLGVGALYNGLGVNAASLRGSDMKYLSLGCMGFAYSSSEGKRSNCGVGIGWIRSDILSGDDRHGLGMHLGLTRNNDVDDHETEKFLGLSYNYFFNGMPNAGWNVGLTPILRWRNDEARGGILLNLGYQF